MTSQAFNMHRIVVLYGGTGGHPGGSARSEHWFKFADYFAGSRGGRLAIELVAALNASFGRAGQGIMATLPAQVDAALGDEYRPARTVEEAWRRGGSPSPMYDVRPLLEAFPMLGTAAMSEQRASRACHLYERRMLHLWGVSSLLVGAGVRACSPTSPSGCTGRHAQHARHARETPMP